MSLFFATLIPGLLLLALGTLFLIGNSAITATFKALPRSQTAAYVFFGTGAAWFLYNVWNLSAADFGEYHVQLFFGFAAVAALSFKLVPDFLAVRGLCVLVLLGAAPLLEAGYMNFAYGEIWNGGRIYFYKIAVYLAIALAIYLGASPFRLRDFFEWLYRSPVRGRVLGAALAVYGLLLVGVAFTY
ncbi:MAG: hypothetical protein JF599_02790 [Verrucomicrobia bacterium]|nr:hypothetical protein [Verrucomicrobiota bacterium]